MIEQILILFLSGTTILLVNANSLNLRRYASILGLAGQPFWIYSTFISSQWGMLALSVVYLYAWTKGFWRDWIKPTKEKTSELIKEYEKVLYVKINDIILSEIQKLAISVDTIEQHERFSKEGKGNSVTFRVRKTNNESPIFTIKPKIDSFSTTDEFNRGCDELEFSLFKNIASRSFKKTRYTIPSDKTGIFFEFDVFERDDGTYSEWVKIDIELPSLDAEHGRLPINVLDMIIRLENNENSMRIEEIYESWNLKNA